MSNDSSPDLSWVNMGDSYNRDLAATPPEDTPPSFYISQERTFVLRVNRPPSRSVTPRPVTPALDDSLQNGQRPPWMLDDSLQDGQRPPWMFDGFNAQPWPAGPTPPWLRRQRQRRQRQPFGYSDMTQDSGFFTEQQPHSTLSQVRQPATPSPPTSPGVYALNLIENMEFSPSPLRQSQMDEWLRSFSPIHSSPDMLLLDVVGGVVFSNSSRRQSEINEWRRSLTPISPSVLNIIVRPQVLPEFDVLIFGRILNATRPSQNATDWAEDGYNDILELHMLALKAVWNDDEVMNQHMDTNEDEELNRHMDEYEGKSRKN